MIKPTDKGSAVIVWDKGDYITEIQSQLDDEDVYERIDNDPVPSINTKIANLLKSMNSKGEIDKKLMNFLRLPKPQLGRLYALPKIHKRQSNVPGRPIIANCGTATENISGYLDSQMKPLMKHIPSVIKDTTEFLNRLKELGDIPPKATLVTFDIVGFYPNIPHEEGLDAMRFYFNKRLDPKVSTDNLISMADIVLKNNYFEFGDDKFHQKRGTDMGTKFAPNYANMFMGQLEERFLSDPSIQRPYAWWRFLDDIFCIWTGTESELLEFLTNCENIILPLTLQ